jgi:hypothetical protein
MLDVNKMFIMSNIKNDASLCIYGWGGHPNGWGGHPNGWGGHPNDAGGHLRRSDGHLRRSYGHAKHQLNIKKNFSPYCI